MFNRHDLLDPANYLTGALAEVEHNRLLYGAHRAVDSPTYHDWLVVDGVRETKVFYRGRIGGDGVWYGHRTRLKNGRRHTVGPEITGSDIRAIAKESGNGVWYIPRAPHMAPLADQCFETNLVTAEWDSPSPDPADWIWLSVLEKFFHRGMAPNSITASGGKCQGLSPHAQWFFNRTIDPREIAYIQHVLARLGADPAPMDKRMSQFRKPGFYRHSKGREQGLFHQTHGEFVDPADWVKAAIAIGEDMGIKIPTPQEWAQQESDKAEQLGNNAPDDLTGIPSEDLERLLVEIDRQCPAYSPGGNTYPYRLKLAGAIFSLVGETKGRSLCPNILAGASIGNLRRNDHPLGTIVNQTRLLLGDPSWNLPEWWESHAKTARQNKYRAFWEKSKLYTPEFILNQRFLDYKDFADGGIYFILSGLGSGKSFNTRQWLAIHWEWIKNSRLIYLGSRNNLLLQECAKSPSLLHIHLFSSRIYLSDPAVHWAGCLDSLIKCQPEDFDGAVLVLDEWVSVLKHLLFSQTEIRKYRDKAITLFIEAVRRSRLVICLDGNMCDWAVAFLAAICPEKFNKTIENVYPNPRPDCHWLRGGLAKDGSLSLNNKDPMIDKILNGAHNGAIAIATDSQTQAETLDSLLTAQGKIVHRIDSKTSGTESVKSFLADPDQWLKDNPVDAVIYTSSAESGIDISIKDYFVSHFGIFFGVVDIDTALQMLGRIRDINCPKWVWAREWACNQDDLKSPIPELLAKAYHDRQQLDLHRVMSGELNGPDIMGKVLETYQLPHPIIEQTSMVIQAQWNYEKGNYRECLKIRLTATGYLLQEFEPDIPLNDVHILHKEARQEVLEQEACAIYAAPIKPIKELNPDKLDDQRSLKKIQLLDQLPGIDNDPVWSGLFVYKILYKNRGLLTQCRRAWMLAHPQVLERLEKEGVKRKLDRYYSGRHSLIWEERTEWAKLWALSESGILAILNHPDPDKPWRPDEPEIQTVIQRCKRKALYLHLGRQGKLDPLQYIGKLLGMVGAGWESKQVRLSNGERVREYHVTRKLEKTPEWAAMTHALDRKWGKYTDTELAPIDWSPPEMYQQNQDGNFPEFLPSSETPQTLTGQALEPVTPGLKNTNRLTGSGVTNFVPEKSPEINPGKTEYIGNQETTGGDVIHLCPQWDEFMGEAAKVLQCLGYSPQESEQILFERYGGRPKMPLGEAGLFYLAEDFWGDLYPSLAERRDSC